MEKPFCGLYMYSHMFDGAVNRKDKPTKSHTISINKQDLNKKCADQW